MIKRRHGNLVVLREPVSAASEQLEREGFAHLPAVLDENQTEALAAEVSLIFESTEVDRVRDANNEFRYAMLNRSALSQKAIASGAILDVIEPLLGQDCHVIANTAWRNIKGHPGGRWHVDAGPHVPRPENVAWPQEIPYPIFAVGMHLFLRDCPLQAGPTAVLAGSHRSGRLPPVERGFDDDLTFDNKKPVVLEAKAGDAILFVSDIWHRGTPAKDGFGRFFLQCHYGRRDLAQRILPTAKVNHLTPEAIGRAQTERERALIGLHPVFFYDG